MVLLARLKKDYPELAFAAGASFCWSPAEQQIGYIASASDQASRWALLHEIAHALLAHASFTSDFSLLKQEVEAWAKAKQLAPSYLLAINEDYIEDCLGTYRNWLYRRSTCPKCLSACLQVDGTNSYLCHNCSYSWQVSRQRFCRPYRRTSKTKSTIV